MMDPGRQAVFPPEPHATCEVMTFCRPVQSYITYILSIFVVKSVQELIELHFYK